MTLYKEEAQNLKFCREALGQVFSFTSKLGQQVEISNEVSLKEGPCSELLCSAMTDPNYGNKSSLLSNLMCQSCLLRLLGSFSQIGSVLLTLTTLNCPTLQHWLGLPYETLLLLRSLPAKPDPHSLPAQISHSLARSCLSGPEILSSLQTLCPSSACPSQEYFLSGSRALFPKRGAAAEKQCLSQCRGKGLLRVNEVESFRLYSPLGRATEHNTL